MANTNFCLSLSFRICHVAFGIVLSDKANCKLSQRNTEIIAEVHDAVSRRFQFQWLVVKSISCGLDFSAKQLEEA
jgi:hypothetical protein